MLIVVVLLIISLLALVASTFSFRMNADLAAVQARQDLLQAEQASRAGIDRVIKLLRDQRIDIDKWYNNRTAFRRILVWAPDKIGGSESIADQEAIPGRPAWRYSVVSYQNMGTSVDMGNNSVKIRYGITDEASKININTASRSQLLTLFDLLKFEGKSSEDLADALLDWRDSNDQQISAHGAESSYYMTLNPPYRAKNKPLDTVEELLMVKNFDGRILYGEDYNRNGYLDANEDDGPDGAFPPDNGDGKLNPGLLPYITVYSWDWNLSNDNKRRIDLNNANFNEPDKLPSWIQQEIRPEVIKFIADARQRRYHFRSVGELVGLQVFEDGTSNYDKSWRQYAKDIERAGRVRTEKATPEAAESDQTESADEKGKNPDQQGTGNNQDKNGNQNQQDSKDGSKNDAKNSRGNNNSNSQNGGNSQNGQNSNDSGNNSRNGGSSNDSRGNNSSNGSQDNSSQGNDTGTGNGTDQNSQDQQNNNRNSGKNNSRRNRSIRWEGEVAPLGPMHATFWAGHRFGGMPQMVVLLVADQSRGSAGNSRGGSGNSRGFGRNNPPNRRNGSRRGQSGQNGSNNGQNNGNDHDQDDQNKSGNQNGSNSQSKDQSRSGDQSNTNDNQNNGSQNNNNDRSGGRGGRNQQNSQNTGNQNGPDASQNGNNKTGDNSNGQNLETGMENGPDQNNNDEQNPGPQEPGQPNAPGIGTSQPAGKSPGKGHGTPIESPVTAQDLPVLMDRLTAQSVPAVAGLINVNTASPIVLKTIPGLTDAQVEQIVAKRMTLNGQVKATPAWLVTSGALDPTTFALISNQVTTRSIQFTVDSIGFADHVGTFKRLEAVIEMRGQVSQIKYYRDITSLGMGYPVRDDEKNGGFAASD